jgi:arginine exporter protein ArgO
MRAALFAIILLTAAANAEITSSAAHGFELAHEIHVSVPRGAAWRAAVDEVDAWWSSDHTMSGDAANMAIDAVPQGCFCETLGADGAVVHLTVTFVNPDVILRMTGALGPLGLMGADGNMVWEFLEAGDGTTIRFSYAVGGYHADGLDRIAPAVDAVIGQALQRLAAFIETGDPEPADAN